MATAQVNPQGGNESKGGKKNKVAANEQTLIPTHPSIDCSGRFAIDKLIRDSGYLIWQRKGTQEPTWVHKRDQYSSNRKIYQQSEVLNMLPDALLEDAKFAEELYLDGKYGDVKKKGLDDEVEYV